MKNSATGRAFRLLVTVSGCQPFSHSVFEKLRFQLVFCLQSFKIDFENALSKLSEQVLFYSAW